MSVYYEIKEHLLLQPGAEPAVAYLMARRLAMLGAAMLMDMEAAVDSLRVKRGAHEITFSGTEVNGSLKEAVALIGAYEYGEEEDCPEEPLEAELAYEYRWSSGDEEFSELQGPFGLCEVLGSFDDEALKKITYTMWSKADCGEGMGSVTCYGTAEDGTVLRGGCEFIKTDTLPADAEWYTEENTFVYDGVPFSAEIAEACRKLSIAAGNPTPDEGETFLMDGQECQSCPDLIFEGEDEGQYYLNFASLPTPDSVSAFAGAMREVLRLTGTEGYEAEFLDVKAKKPRMLRITVTKNGEIEYAVTGR